MLRLSTCLKAPFSIKKHNDNDCLLFLFDSMLHILAYDRYVYFE